MSKFGSETNDKISPLSTSSKAPPPVALKVFNALSSSLLIKYCIFVSNVSSRVDLLRFYFLVLYQNIFQHLRYRSYHNQPVQLYDYTS